RLPKVVDRACERCEVEDDIDWLVDLKVLDHVVIQKDEAVVAEVLEVLERARLQIVHADDAGALREQVFAEMGAEKTGAARDDGSGHHGIVSAVLAGSGRVAGALRTPYAVLGAKPCG